MEKVRNLVQLLNKEVARLTFLTLVTYVLTMVLIQVEIESFSLLVLVTVTSMLLSLCLCIGVMSKAFPELFIKIGLLPNENKPLATVTVVEEENN